MSVGMAAYNEIGSVPWDYPEPGLLLGGAPAQVDGDPSASPHAYSGSDAGAPLNTNPANDAGGAPQVNPSDNAGAVSVLPAQDPVSGPIQLPSGHTDVPAVDPNSGQPMSAPANQTHAPAADPSAAIVAQLPGQNEKGSMSAAAGPDMHKHHVFPHEFSTEFRTSGCYQS